MTNKFFTTLTTLSLLAMLLLAAAGKSAAAKTQIDSRKMPPVRQKVMLPCKAIAKDVATTLYVTNNTNKALPNNQAIYYSTDKNVKGYFQTSNQIATGADATYPLNPSAGSTCQAWVLQ